MKMKLAEFAAVVAGAEAEDAVGGSRFEGDFHRVTHRRFVDAVDDDLVGAVGAVDQIAFDAAAERGAVSVVGRGDHAFIRRATLLPLRTTPPGNGVMIPTSGANASLARRAALRATSGWGLA